MSQTRNDRALERRISARNRLLTQLERGTKYFGAKILPLNDDDRIRIKSEIDTLNKRINA